MNEIIIPLRYSYSCQYCGKLIESLKQLEMIPFTLPLCSNKCKYQLIYQTLLHYDENELVKLYLGNDNSERHPTNKNLLIFKITKKIADSVLPSIKPLIENNKSQIDKKVTNLQQAKNDKQITNTLVFVICHFCLSFFLRSKLEVVI